MVLIYIILYFDYNIPIIIRNNNADRSIYSLAILLVVLQKSVSVMLVLNKCWSTDFYGRRNCTIRSSSRSHNSWFVDLSYIMIRLGGSPELLASSRRNLWSRKQPATSWLSRPKCGFERPSSREHYDRTSSARE